MKTGGEECARQRRNRRSAIPALLPGARRVDRNTRRGRVGTCSLFCPQKGDVEPPSSSLRCNVWGNEAEQDFSLLSPWWKWNQRGVSPPGRMLTLLGLSESCLQGVIPWAWPTPCAFSISSTPHQRGNLLQASGHIS